MGPRPVPGTQWAAARIWSLEIVPEASLLLVSSLGNLVGTEYTSVPCTPFLLGRLGGGGLITAWRALLLALPTTC